MLELFAEIGDRIVRGGFKTHLVVYILCSALGILILQWLFAKALRVVARKTNTPYALLQQTFRGIPALLTATERVLGAAAGTFAAPELHPETLRQMRAPFLAALEGTPR